MTPTSSDMDEIWAILAQEGQENLSLIEDALLKLEKKPGSRDEIATLFRALHTFKGTVRMMDFSNTESVAHHAEDLVALVRDEGIALDQEMIELLLVAMDKMRSLLEHILAHHCDVEPQEVVSISGQLKNLVEQKQRIAAEIELPPDPGHPQSILPQETQLMDDPAQPLELDLPPFEKTPQEEKDLLNMDDVLETGQEAFIFEPVNLAEDPEYVKMYLDVCLPELDCLHDALDAFRDSMLTGASPVQFGQVHESLETLQIASERMGYLQICSLLEVIVQFVNPEKTSYTTSDVSQLNGLEEMLSDEFKRLQTPRQTGAVDQSLLEPDDSQRPAPAAETPVSPESLPDLYHYWYDRQVEADLDRLESLIEALRKNSRNLNTGDTDQQKVLAEDLNDVLGSLYHSCFYCHLDTAAHLTLILEDISVRIRQEEIPITESFINLLQTYHTHLQEAFSTSRADQSLLTLTFEAMISLSRQIINLTARNPMLQVTRTFINNLDIAPQFKEVLTPENLAEISQSLRAGMNLFTILANLDEDEEMGIAFQNWVQSGSITPISNITTSYGQQQCVFTFLVTSSSDFKTIQEELKQIDPDGKFLNISPCLPRSTARTALPADARYFNNVIRSSHPDTGITYGGSLPIEVLAEMTEMVGGLVADQSTLNRVISRLSEMNTTESVMRLIRASFSGSNTGTEVWEKIHSDLQAYWASWEMDISTLAQTEVKLNAALIQLQEKTRSLGLRPAAELLDPLPKIAQTVAFRQGKQATIECRGGDSELDQRTLKTLVDTVHSLVAYCINESIELPEQRTQAGKNAAGRLWVSVVRTENHNQITIEDDGSGLDFKKILARGDELGWNGAQISDEELTEWLFKPEYYAQTSMSINLAILRSILQAEKGKLTLAQKPDSGLRFIITLQLDMAVMDGMVVRIEDIRYIVPVFAIQRILQPTEENLIEASADGGGSLLNMEGKVYPVRSFKSRAAREAARSQQQPRLLVIIEKDPQSVALEVDELIGRQSVLVRPLSRTLGSLRNTIGCALLGEGEVGMVLDLEAL